MDWTTILVAILALCGTAIGSVAGVKQANKVVDLRINNLEKKMDKHNCLIERMTTAERDIKIICTVSKRRNIRNCDSVQTDSNYRQVAIERFCRVDKRR